MAYVAVSCGALSVRTPWGVAPFMRAKRFLYLLLPALTAMLWRFAPDVVASGLVPIAAPAHGAVTLRTVWRWGTNADPVGTYLVALTRDPDAAVPQVGIVWRQDRSGWFPTWRLELQLSDADGSVQRTERLWQGSFTPGATYEVLLSVHPETGSIAAAVYDRAQPDPIATFGLQADLGGGPWYPAVTGPNAVPPLGPQLIEAEANAGYLPVDGRFQVGERTSAGSLLPLFVLQHGGAAAVYIQHHLVPPGTYRLSARPVHMTADGTAAEAALLVERIEPAPSRWIDLPVERLPLGPVELVLEYLEDGRVLYAHRRTVTVGAASLRFTEYRVDSGQGAATAQIYAEAHEELADVVVTIRGRFTEVAWNPERQELEETALADAFVAYSGPLGALTAGSPSALKLPLPGRDGTWRLDLEVEATPAVQLNLTGAREYLAVGGDEHWIAVTDQASQRILVFDPNVPDWNDPAALKWSWYPNADNGFSASTPGWGLPSGVKLRKSEVWGGEWMVVVDSRGLAAIVPYPAGNERKWSHVIAGNLHSAELLPDGNVAIAASTGGWVRVYTSSQGPDSRTYAEYALPGAHGVLWDPSLELLWAVGDHVLVGLRVGGTPDAPVLEKVRETALPTPWGHDLSPVYGDPDRLWVTTNTRVYQYVKSTDTWITAFFGGDRLNLPTVKGVGNQPSGRVALTQPKAGSLYEWTTDTVTLLFPYEERTRDGAAFYKARVWSPEYQ